MRDHGRPPHLLSSASSTLGASPSRSARSASSPRAERGITLIELLVGIAIAGILGIVASPSFSGLLVRSTLHSLSANLGADLAFARSEALRLGSAVSICPAADAEGSSCATGNDWNQGWLVFRENAASIDGQIGSGEAILRQQGPAPGDTYRIQRIGEGNGAITFVPGGSTRTGAEAVLTISHPDGPTRRLTVSVIGRLTTTLVP